MQVTAEKDGRFYSFDQLLAIVQERELHGGGALFVAPPLKGRRRRKKTVLISAGELSQLRCCTCGRHFFRGGFAGENASVVVLQDKGAKVLVPLCGFCADLSDRQEAEKQQITASANLEVSEEGQTAMEDGEHDEIAAVDTSSVVTPEFSSSSIKMSVSGVGARDGDLLPGHHKSGVRASGKCLKRERVLGATGIRRNCGRRGARR